MRLFQTFLIICVFQLGFAQLNTEAIVKAESEAYEKKNNHKYKKYNLGYDVIFHRLSLEIDPAVRFISGSVYTEFKAEINGLSQIVFDLDDRMTVDSVIYHGSNIGFSQSNDELNISIQTLNLGDTDSLLVHYHGDPSVNEQKGFSYDYHATGPIAWTLSEPYGAYGWWPCKQQLEDKVDSFEMFVTVPKGNKAAGLGLLQSVDTLSDSSLVFHWIHKYPVATYLVAVAVTNYNVFTHFAKFSDGDSIAILEYMYPEFMFIADTQALKIEPMMYLFDSLFGDYPFRNEKYGHAQWGRGGGMEHQTMSFMSDLDFDLMAHELAHQWYGDKITCGSWKDIWLNEGFATYLTCLAYEKLRPRSEWEEYIKIHLNRATSEPDGSVYVYDTTSVSRIFSGRLSYSKAALVLHMLRWELGDEDFYQGMRDYTANVDLCYEFARTGDFIDAMENVSGKDLTDFFVRWVYSEGFPILSIKWSRKTTNSIEFDIAEVPSHSSVSLFPLNIEFQLYGSNGEDTIVLVPLSSLAQISTIEVGFKVVNVVYDPNIWLLAKATIVEGDHKDLAAVALFPNPSNSSFEVYIKDKRIDSIEVYDNLGQLVQANLSYSRKNETVLVKHELSRGLYYVKAYVGSEAVVARLIVVN